MLVSLAVDWVPWLLRLAFFVVACGVCFDAARFSAGLDSKRWFLAVLVGVVLSGWPVPGFSVRVLVGLMVGLLWWGVVLREGSSDAMAKSLFRSRFDGWADEHGLSHRFQDEFGNQVVQAPKIDPGSLELHPDGRVKRLVMKPAGGGVDGDRLRENVKAATDAKRVSLKPLRGVKPGEGGFVEVVTDDDGLPSVLSAFDDPDVKGKIGRFGHEFYFGLLSTGDDWVVDINTSPMFAVQGQTGSGKGSVLGLVLVQALLSGGNASVIAGKYAAEFGWVSQAGGRVVEVDMSDSGSVSKAFGLVVKFWGLMNDHKELLYKYGAENWGELEEMKLAGLVDEDVRREWIVLDESKSFLLSMKDFGKVRDPFSGGEVDMFRAVSKIWSQIAMKGRSLGVHMVMCSQRLSDDAYSLVPGDGAHTRGQMSNRFTGVRGTTFKDAKFILEEIKAADWSDLVVDVRGRMALETIIDGHAQVVTAQTAWIGRDADSVFGLWPELCVDPDAEPEFAGGLGKGDSQDGADEVVVV